MEYLSSNVTGKSDVLKFTGKRPVLYTEESARQIEAIRTQTAALEKSYEPGLVAVAFGGGMLAISAVALMVTGLYGLESRVSAPWGWANALKFSGIAAALSAIPFGMSFYLSPTIGQIAQKEQEIADLKETAKQSVLTKLREINAMLQPVDSDNMFKAQSRQALLDIFNRRVDERIAPIFGRENFAL